MRNFKKTLALALAVIFVLSIVSCGVKKIGSDENDKPKTENTQNGSDSSETAGNTDGSETTEDKPTSAEPETTGEEDASDGDRTASDTETEKDTETEPEETEPETTEAPQTEAPQTEAPQTEAPQTEALQTEAPQTEAPQTEALQTEAPQTEAPSGSDDVVADLVFVGDSICSGFRVYSFLPANQVLAEGNVGARSLFDYSYTVNGVPMDIVSAVKAVNPKYVVFSMGMNDINMTTPEQYCDNYDRILSAIHEAVPGAKLYVASITPTYNATYFSNDRIDLFNSTISAHLAGTGYGFIDVSPYLKDSSTNSLISTYHSGDGIHLAPAAYQIFLSVVTSTIG